jgi:hypothetical protein
MMSYSIYFNGPELKLLQPFDRKMPYTLAFLSCPFIGLTVNICRLNSYNHFPFDGTISAKNKIDFFVLPPLDR